MRAGGLETLENHSNWYTYSTYELMMGLCSRLFGGPMDVDSVRLGRRDVSWSESQFYRTMHRTVQGLREDEYNRRCVVRWHNSPI